MIPALCQTMETDVLVLGGGTAGIRAAIEARRQGVEVLITSTFKAGHGNNSAISYGGFDATDFDPDRQDSPRRHYEDTLKGGCGLNRPFLVRLLTERAWSEAKALEKMGVLFQKDSHGTYVRYGRGGHSVARRLATPNNSGMALLSPLLKYATSLNIAMLNGVKAIRLLKQGGRICGALLIDRRGKWQAVGAKSVILATGGGGALYPKTTNVPSATGDGYALAYEAGLALQDMEFVQFVLRHVKEPEVPGRLPPIETLLLKGAKLVDSRGESIQEEGGGRPSFTRDALSQMVAREIARNEGQPNFARLDLRSLPREEISQIARLKKEFLKVYPAAHFFMGGIRVDENLSTPVEGLFAAGEVMGGVHGANRLGGNALAETLVFGSLAGSLAAQFALRSGRKHLFQEDQAGQGMNEVVGHFGGNREGNLPELEEELKSLTEKCAGVIRDRKKMEEGLTRLGALKKALPLLSPGEHENYWPLFTFRNQLMVTEMVLQSALKREETRGAHYREDFPLQDDKDWLANIVIKRGEEGRMKLSFEPVRSSLGKES